MELHQLATFRAVAQTLSFTQAAAALNYAQSTVSAQIQGLEEELGVTLFDRLGKRVALTGAGELLLAYAERLLNLAEETRVVVSGQDGLGGALTISAPETLCAYRLPEVLRRFRSRFPGVKLVIRYGGAVDLPGQLGRGLMDVGFVIGEPLRESNLVVEPLATEPLLLLVQPDHPLARRPRLALADLQQEPLLLTEAGCSYRVIFERAMARAGVQAGAKLEFHSVEAIKQSAMAGLGVAVLPEITVAAELRRGQLARLAWDGHLPLVTQMFWHKDKWLSPAIRTFLEMVREVVKTGDVPQRIESTG
jgi:DNA-binding transcriptional LysR family regulator